MLSNSTVRFRSFSSCCLSKVTWGAFRMRCDGASALDADALLCNLGRCSRRGLCSLRGAPFVCQSLVTGGAPKGWRGLPGGAPFCCSSGSSCLGVVGAPKEPPSLRHAGRKLRLGCVPASAIAADPQVSPRCGGFLVFF